MAKKGSTSINIKVVATAGQGGSGKSQQHNIRALGLGHESVRTQKVIDGKLTIVTSSHHILEDFMNKHFADKGIYYMPPEERRELNRLFMADVNGALAQRGIVEASDRGDRMVMDHVDPSLTPKNDFLIINPLEKYLDEVLRPLVKEKTGQRMHDACTPYKEGVIVIKPDTTIEDLKVFAEEVKKNIGWSPMQIYIHHDEGHIDKQTGEWKENYHAHIIFDTINHETGRTIQLNRLDLAKMQTILAQSIGMERGENSSDLVHKNSLEFKAQMEQADMRLNLSLSAVGVGQEPRKLMADAILGAIESMPIDKPNDRNTINLLRVVGKDLNVNPTKLCAEAIFEKLQEHPEKLEDIAKILNVETKGKPVEESLNKIQQSLLGAAVWCGKTESAKAFRPLLNSAKALDLNLVPVMLNPIRVSVNTILASPIDCDNNNMLWCATDRCIGKTQANVPALEIINGAIKTGTEELKAKAENNIAQAKTAADERDGAIQDTIVAKAMLRDIEVKTSEIVRERDSAIQETQVARKGLDDIVAKTFDLADSSMNKVLCEKIKDKLAELSSAEPDMTLVSKVASACIATNISPSRIVSDFLSYYVEKHPDAELSARFLSNFDTTPENFRQTLYRLADKYDREHIVDNAITESLKPKYILEFIQKPLEERVQQLSDKDSPAATNKLKEAAECLGVDIVSISKELHSNFTKDLDEKKQQADYLVVEIVSGKEILTTLDNSIKAGRETMDELEVAIAVGKEKELQLSSNISGLERKKALIEQEMGEKAQTSSIVGTLINLAEKGAEAIENHAPKVISDLTRRDIKETTLDLMMKLSEKNFELENLKKKIQEEKNSSFKSGVVKGRSQAAIDASSQIADKQKIQDLEKAIGDLRVKLKESISSNNKTESKLQEKDRELAVEKQRNSVLTKIVNATMSLQPKAIQFMNEIKGFSLQNILDAIRDKVVANFSGILTHPSYPKDPVKIENKDIIIKTDNDEPLVSFPGVLVRFSDLAENEHRQNMGKGQGRGV